MGYRSEVAIVITREAFEGLKKSAKDADVDISFGDFSLIDAEAGEDEHWVLMQFHDVKWYDGYHDVDLVMNTVRATENYLYIRVGEDFDDIEREQDGEECAYASIYPCSYIDVDGVREKVFDWQEEWKPKAK